MPEPTTFSHSDLDPLSDRVEELQVGPCRVLALRTPVRGVVSWRGSIRTLPDFASGEELIQALTVAMLDKGTQQRDRFTVAETLEDRGAQLSFSSDGLRVSVQGRALSEHVPVVLELMAEQLRTPLFDPAEFEKARAQYRAGLQRSLENTSAQANAALSRRLYDAAHPNYTQQTEVSVEQLDELTVEDVRTYHDRHFGANELLVVLVGDIELNAIEAALHEAFDEWVPQQAAGAFKQEGAAKQAGRSDVPMPGKMNIDVRMGHTLSLLRQDDDYLPLYVGNYVLGGNFSARLMAKVRDELGLTYGIRTSLNGVTTEYQGHWQIGVTLSQEHIAEGIEATLAEARRFVEEGPTPEEVQDKQTTITGGYKVGLATTGGLANTLHLNAVRGFDIGYLDRFPAEVEALTAGQIRDAVQRHLDPSRLHLALAGTLPQEAAEH